MKQVLYLGKVIDSNQMLILGRLMRRNKRRFSIVSQVSLMLMDINLSITMLDLFQRNINYNSEKFWIKQVIFTHSLKNMKFTSVCMKITTGKLNVETHTISMSVKEQKEVSMILMGNLRNQ